MITLRRHLAHSVLLSICTLILSLLHACKTHGDETAKVPTWTPDAKRVAELGEIFQDERIHIRLPKGLKPLAQNPIQLDAQGGIVLYGWTPTGEVPSATSLLVYVFPPTAGKPEPLDDFVIGLKESVGRQLENTKFEPSKVGLLGGAEAITVNFAGDFPDVGRVQCSMLALRDKQGTLAVAMMRPVDAKGEPTRSAMTTSALTIARSQGAQ